MELCPPKKEQTASYVGEETLVSLKEVSRNIFQLLMGLFGPVLVVYV